MQLSPVDKKDMFTLSSNNKLKSSSVQFKVVVRQQLGLDGKLTAFAVLFALCNGVITRHFHIFRIVKLLYLSYIIDREPFDDAQGFELATDLSPSDQFMAADAILIAMFQFLFCFLAQAKYRTLALFYGALNDSEL